MNFCLSNKQLVWSSDIEKTTSSKFLFTIFGFFLKTN